MVRVPHKISLDLMTERTERKDIQVAQQSWLSFGVRSICVIGGAVTGAVAGVCAVAGFVMYSVLNDPSSNCKNHYAPQDCIDGSIAISFIDPALLLTSAVGMMPFGALAGNQIANKILHQKQCGPIKEL